MKASALFAILSYNYVNANFSYGACQSFEDIGLVDKPMVIADAELLVRSETYGDFPIDDEDSQYEEMYRTTDTIWGGDAECSKATFEIMGDSNSQTMMHYNAWYWYGFATYWTSDHLFQWNSSTSKGYMVHNFWDTWFPLEEMEQNSYALKWDNEEV